MRKAIETIKDKILAAEVRATTALKNDEGMEVVQFLAVALLSITVGALLVTTLKGSLNDTITNAGTKLSGLFSFS